MSKHLVPVCIAASLALVLSLSGCEKAKEFIAKFKKTEPQAAAAPAAAQDAPPAPGGTAGGEAADNPDLAAPDTAPAIAADATPAAPGAKTTAPAGPASINKNAAVIALCYHNIEDKGSRALTITTEQFRKEMQALKDHGFTVIGMQDFLAWRRSEKDIPAKSALITIDDGWLSGYTNAWPILKEFDYPFTLFVYINYIGSGGKSLSWEQLAELRDAGVDIQSHTYSHSNLRTPGGGVDRRTAEMVRKDVAELGREGWLQKEILGSKQELEKQLGIRVNAIAYPFGIYSKEVMAMVEKAGYEAAFSVYGQQLRHSSPPFNQLGRYAIDANKPEIFDAALKMSGGGAVGAPGPATAPAVAQVAAASMVTQPMEGETISNPRPTIKANLATMGDIDPASIEMRISGMGLVPAQYDLKTKTVTYAVAQKLRDKNYTVILNAKLKDGKRVETRWSFNFDPTRAGGGGGAAAGASPAGAAVP